MLSLKQISRQMKSIYVCIYEMLNNVNRSMMCVNILEGFQFYNCIKVFNDQIYLTKSLIV